MLMFSLVFILIYRVYVASNFRLQPFRQAAWPKKLYEDDRVFRALLELTAEESDLLLREGLERPYDKQRYHAAILAITGDWQWLQKSGALRRSYTSALKHTAQTASPAGICHLCQAGQTGYPFEQLDSRSPKWLPTCNAEDPFELPPSPLTRLPHAQGTTATLWRYDFWHTLHLGVCKNFIGSMVALYSATFPGRSKEARFQLLSQHFLAWCRSHGRPPLLTKVTKDTIGWDAETMFPCGIWYKGAISTNFCEYLEEISSGQVFEENMLNTCSEAIRALNILIRGLYESEVFLDPVTAERLGEQGLRFLRRYTQLAREAVEQKRCLFSLVPKLHCLHHLCLQDLVEASKTQAVVLNPVCFSVQQSEDYIGRNSRTSRRVHPAQCAQRVLEIHLKAAYDKYVKAGLLLPQS